MPTQYPNGILTFPFSGIQSGYVVHPYHVSDVYIEISGIEQIIGFNPLNGYASITARISGLENGAAGEVTGVVFPLGIKNGLLSGNFASATDSGFLKLVDWLSFNSKLAGGNGTLTGHINVGNSGIYNIGGPLSSLSGVYADNHFGINAFFSGFVGIGDSPSATARLVIQAIDAGSTNQAFIINNSNNSAIFTVRDDGFVVTPSTVQASAVNATTYDPAPNNTILKIQGRSFTTVLTGVQLIYGGSNTITNSSGQFIGVAITPTLNQTGTAGYTALLINAVESSTGTGSKLLIDAQSSGVSRFSVNDSGIISFVTGNFATSINSGFLSAADWNTFNNKSNTAVGSYNQTFNETPAGAVNSSNVTYTLQNAPTTNSLLLFKNGTLLTLTNDYTLSNKTITTISAPVSGAILDANYIWASTTGIGLYTVGVTTPSTTVLNSMTTWGNTTGTQLLTNSGITTDGNISITIGGNLSGFTSGVQNIGSQSLPFSGAYVNKIIANQYQTTLLTGTTTANSFSIDWSLGSSQVMNFNPGINGLTTGTFVRTIPGSTYILKTIQNPSGTTNIKWPNLTYWSQGISGVMTTSGNAIDIFTFFYDGSNYYGNQGFNYGIPL